MSADSTSTKEMREVIIKLGGGTFGRVLTSTSSLLVYKSVRRIDNSLMLQAEFRWTQLVHDALKDQDSIDEVPSLVDAVISNDPYFPRSGVLLDHMLNAYEGEAQAIAETNQKGKIVSVAKEFARQLRMAMDSLKNLTKLL
ncbi:hypothetical protein PGT21_016598 [Puccinia graminis f. sp. tritici]|uniref:Uncharacterized protein n=1 Tax=Puccinia graminis f. sp. tritici TaxID=56615 RepID=A0A5B0NCA8_PUCGR|nr:hypothetical protein PGT21_016598 [Puccinia graminis f. sp. tritici]KAA1129382.1 hypothetical protein PGTUg99_031437 [Puccinia graminis f. sp. tritici]